LVFNPNDTKYNPAAMIKVQKQWRRHSRRGNVAYGIGSEEEDNPRRLELDTAEQIAQLLVS
jgi:hypothetical protein